MKLEIREGREVLVHKPDRVPLLRASDFPDPAVRQCIWVGDNLLTTEQARELAHRLDTWLITGSMRIPGDG